MSAPCKCYKAIDLIFSRTTEDMRAPTICGAATNFPHFIQTHTHTHTARVSESEADKAVATIEQSNAICNFGVDAKTVQAKKNRRAVVVAWAIDTPCISASTLFIYLFVFACARIFRGDDYCQRSARQAFGYTASSLMLPSFHFRSGCAQL